mmetsp:Transcript_6991/g.9458  ORF Transcript_6991/g.9458 Transcript_6991/m.9458 type:complete len:82 (-) Transcript_6991:87-332(-)
MEKMLTSKLMLNFYLMNLTFSIVYHWLPGNTLKKCIDFLSVTCKLDPEEDFKEHWTEPVWGLSEASGSNEIQAWSQLSDTT